MSLGNAVVKSNFQKSYELSVTTLQAAALLLFSDPADTAPKPFSSIGCALAIPDDILKRVMHSLSCGKYKVLKRISSAASSARSDSKETEGEASASASAASSSVTAASAENASASQEKGIRMTDLFAYNEAFR